MLVALLEYYLPAGWQLLPEFLLGRLPQRVNIVVLRLVQQAADPARRLHSIFNHLRPHTLIEHKGPTDEIEPGDALTLLGYAAQYMRLNKLSEPDRAPPLRVLAGVRDGPAGVSVAGCRRVHSV